MLNVMLQLFLIPGLFKFSQGSEKPSVGSITFEIQIPILQLKIFEIQVRTCKYFKYFLELFHIQNTFN